LVQLTAAQVEEIVGVCLRNDSAFEGFFSGGEDVIVVEFVSWDNILARTGFQDGIYGFADRWGEGVLIHNASFVMRGFTPVRDGVD
jgi:hypothetical protein